MRTAIIFLAAVAVVGVSAFRDSDESDSDEYTGTTTRSMPCPDADMCTQEYDPVCARDKEGNLYKFSNRCMLEICGCRMWLQQLPLRRCRYSAPGCPLDHRQPAQRRSDESSDESQLAPSSERRHHGNNDLRHESEENW